MEYVTMGAGSVRAEHIFIDFGCGRVRASLLDLSEEEWNRLCDLVRSLGGHALLEKAPDAFKKRRDVFGSPQPSWRVMHQIKDALDPKNIFAPGRSPGRK